MPIFQTCSPAADKQADSRIGIGADTTTAIPIPQLNTRCISASATPPCFCSHENSGGSGQPDDPAQRQTFTQHARNIFDQPAARDVRHALHAICCISASSGFT
jgi:hypothetical protein